jgi:hypothetical protein
MTNRRAFITGLATLPFVASAIPAIAATDTGWEQAVRELKLAAAASSTLPDDCPEALFDTVTSMHCHKLRAVSSYPVSTLAMLREKMDLLVAEYGIDDMGSGDEIEHIYADIQRLAGGA